MTSPTSNPEFTPQTAVPPASGAGPSLDGLAGMVDDARDYDRDAALKQLARQLFGEVVDPAELSTRIDDTGEFIGDLRLSDRYVRTISDLLTDLAADRDRIVIVDYATTRSTVRMSSEYIVDHFEQLWRRSTDSVLMFDMTGTWAVHIAPNGRVHCITPDATGH